MVKTAMLRTDLATLRMLESGIASYALLHDGHGPCHVILRDGRSVRITANGFGVAPRFECFHLALDADALPAEPLSTFATAETIARTSVLIREEYIEPFAGDPSQLFGQPPATVQSAAKPGHIPKSAITSCLVAYGLVFEAGDDRLVIACDWFPMKLEAATDPERIEVLLGESEVLSISRYIQVYRQ